MYLPIINTGSKELKGTPSWSEILQSIYSQPSIASNTANDSLLNIRFRVWMRGNIDADILGDVFETTVKQVYSLIPFCRSGIYLFFISSRPYMTTL